MSKNILFRFTESFNSSSQIPLAYRNFFSVASSLGYNITTVYNSDYIYDVFIFFKIEDSIDLIESLIKSNPYIRFIHLRFEETCICPFNHILYTNSPNFFSLSWRYFDNKQIFLNTIPQHIPTVNQSAIPLFATNPPQRKLRKNLICMILSNKYKPFRDLLTGSRYSYRKQLATDISKSGCIDIYGAKWDYLLNSFGYVTDLQDTLQSYDFNLIIANSDEENNVCEKIFNSFYSGAIPIYIGASKINRFIPSSLYLQFEFGTPAEVILRTLSSYNDKSILEWRARILEYLNTGDYSLFTDQYFTTNLINLINSSSSDSNLLSSSKSSVTYLSLLRSLLYSRLTFTLKIFGIYHLIKKSFSRLC